MRDTIEFVIGTEVGCSGANCGRVTFIVVDPLAKKLTHVIVAPDSAREPARLVPVELVKRTRDGIELLCTMDDFQALEPAVETYFLRDPPGDWGPRSDQVLGWPFFAMAPGGSGIATPAIADLEPQYRVPPGEVLVRRGQQVRAADGPIGKVSGLVVDHVDGMVTHILLEQGHLWGRKQVAIPIGDVTGLDEDGVAVRLTKDEIRDLPPVEIEGQEVPEQAAS
jgi:hypothetical protein